MRKSRHSEELADRFRDGWPSKLAALRQMFAKRPHLPETSVQEDKP
jgi:hypothetical protein